MCDHFIFISQTERPWDLCPSPRFETTKFVILGPIEHPSQLEREVIMLNSEPINDSSQVLITHSNFF